MSDGFLFWYESGWSAGAAAHRIASLETAGLRLAHPGTGRITAISTDLDTIGDQFDIDRSALIQAAALADTDEFSFQYWLDDDTDLFCTIKRLAYDQVVERFYLDGLTLDQQDLVIATVVDQVQQPASRTFGLVVDRRGGSANVDWDAITCGAPETAAVLPDLVGLPENVTAKHPELHQFTAQRIGTLTCYDISHILNRSR